MPMEVEVRRGQCGPGIWCWKRGEGCARVAMNFRSLAMEAGVCPTADVWHSFVATCNWKL